MNLVKECASILAGASDNIKEIEMPSSIPTEFREVTAQERVYISRLIGVLANRLTDQKVNYTSDRDLFALLMRLAQVTAFADNYDHTTILTSKSPAPQESNIKRKAYRPPVPDDQKKQWWIDYGRKIRTAPLHNMDATNEWLKKEGLYHGMSIDNLRAAIKVFEATEGGETWDGCQYNNPVDMRFWHSRKIKEQQQNANR